LPERARERERKRESMAAGGEHGANGLQEHAGALEEGRGGENQAGCETSEQTLNRTGKQPMLSVQFVQKVCSAYANYSTKRKYSSCFPSSILACLSRKKLFAPMIQVREKQTRFFAFSHFLEEIR
jgi:hypothetical protein